MDLKTIQQLEEAKALFYSWRLLDAYSVLKRFFDRIPFRYDKLHAEYIGMFARTLIELGKDYDLKFYMSELERIYSHTRDPFVGYPLAVIYTYLSEPRFESAREIFESILRDAGATEFHNRAKMMLADYYDRKEDPASSRMMIESILQPRDQRESHLVEIWKAYVDRLEKKLKPAQLRLENLLQELSVETDWYAYFSANLVLAMVYAESHDLQSARKVAEGIRAVFSGRYFKSIQVQLRDLEQVLSKEEQLGSVRYARGIHESCVQYANKTLRLKVNTPADKLLLLLVKKRMVDKAGIVKNLYRRQYCEGQDDKLIYYHIHSLRKRLRQLGLPNSVIRNDGNQYHWVADVDIEDPE